MDTVTRRGAVVRYASHPPMGVTVYGRPQGVPNGNASLELTVHHPGGGRAVHRVNLWDSGDQLAHSMVHSGDHTARGAFADWADENQEHFQSIPEDYRRFVGQLIRRGHRWTPEPPVEDVQPEQPVEPTPMSRRAAVVRYGAAEDEASFHRAMENEPHERTHALVYADWLEDNGRPALAHLIRLHTADHEDHIEHTRQRHAERGGEHGIVPDYTVEDGTKEQGPFVPPTVAYMPPYRDYSEPPDRPETRAVIDFAAADPRYGKDSIAVSQRAVHNPKVGFRWTKWLPREESTPLLQGLQDEGVPLGGVDVPLHASEERYGELTRRVLNREHSTPPTEPTPMSRRSVMVRRYTAYRAPAGGMIARGSVYKGGEMVPSMESAFMNPVKKSESESDSGFGGTAPETVETPHEGTYGRPAKVRRRAFDPGKIAALRAKFAKPLVVSFSRRGKVTRYSATHEGLPAMLAAISPRAWRGWRGEGQPTHIDLTPRLVAADYLQDLGRDQEAAILRDTTKHAYLHPHGIRDAARIARDYGEGDIHRAARAYPDLRQYIDTALWSSSDDDGNPLDNEYNVTHIHPDTLAAMTADAYHFSTANQPTFDDTSSSESDRGHDFWLSRNGHGTGFWNKPEVYGEHGQTLHDAAEKHGSYDLGVGDDGMIHGDYEVEPTEPPHEDDGTGPGHPTYTGGPNSPGGTHYVRTSRYRVRYGADRTKNEPVKTGDVYGSLEAVKPTDEVHSQPSKQKWHIRCKNCGREGTALAYFLQKLRQAPKPVELPDGRITTNIGSGCPQCGRKKSATSMNAVLTSKDYKDRAAAGGRAKAANRKKLHRRGVMVRRYSADHATVDALLHQLSQPEHNEHRWGLDNPLNGYRGITADALDDVERGDEAELLRRPNTHVMVHGGRVVPAQFTENHLFRATGELADHIYANDSRGFDGWHTTFHGDPDPVNPTDHADDYEPLGPNEHRFWGGEYDNFEHWKHHISDVGQGIAELVSRNVADEDATYEEDDDDPRQHARWQEYERLAHALRTAPYEEPIPHSPQRTTSHGEVDENPDRPGNSGSHR